MRSHRDETTESLEWGDLLVEFETFPAGLDTAPLLRGLPGDACPCPHWGFVFKGSFLVKYADHEETVSAGEAFYLEPGHVPVFLEETEMFEVSPAAQLRDVMEVVTKNAEKLEGGVPWQRIDRRFRGPEQSGNGGYTCGLVAGVVGGPAEVTLRGRPPLDQDLAVEVAGTEAQVYAGEEQIVTARAIEGVEVDLPEPPSFEEAVAASGRSVLVSVDIEKHAYPSCFVCGLGRGERDGLRIFPGPVEGRPEIVAAPWLPDDSLGGNTIDDVFVWSALDCPSGFAWVHLDLLMILGRMAGEVIDRPAVGERCVTVGFPIERDGRKLHAGSAVYGEDGRLLGRSRSTWITLGAWAG